MYTCTNVLTQAPICTSMHFAHMSTKTRIDANEFDTLAHTRTYMHTLSHTHTHGVPSRFDLPVY